jgi:8-oxo-dGTP pyrophosphatase MutT (NUDIX family)
VILKWDRKFQVLTALFLSCKLLSPTNLLTAPAGGKVDDTDETLLHAAARELKEETGLTARRVVQKVQHFDFNDERPGRPPKIWRKVCDWRGGSIKSADWLKQLIFHLEVQDMADITLDPLEHQAHVFASKEEVVKDRVGDVKLVYISPPNKEVKLEAFRLLEQTADVS